MNHSANARMAGAALLLLVAAGLALFRAGMWPFPPAPREERSSPGTIAVRVGPATLTVEVVRTPATWARGLSKRRTLAPGAGMLFLFPVRAARVFWMKDTWIPLDIIWVLEERVVGVSAEVQPEPGTAEADLRQYVSPGPVDLVIETRAGWTRAVGVRTGDVVVVP